MRFASDNTSGASPEVMAALIAANEGFASSYGADQIMAEVTVDLRRIFEAPDAVVHLVATGTAANALALASLVQPWQTVFCHTHAHIEEDECGAPEFFSNGAKLVLVPGDHGKIDPTALTRALHATGGSVHGVQPGALSLTNVTEAGTVYRPDEIATLAAMARARGIPTHLDGARFANALCATGATPAEMTWKAGVDVLSFGATKNGCLGVEAVIFFDPAKDWEFQLRRKRAGHLWSKHRFLAAQMQGYLAQDAWLNRAAHANAKAKRLAQGVAAHPDVTLLHPVDANVMFVHWSPATEARLRQAGAAFLAQPAPEGRLGARLVTSWATTDADIDAFLTALAG